MLWQFSGQSQPFLPALLLNLNQYQAQVPGYEHDMSLADKLFFFSLLEIKQNLFIQPNKDMPNQKQNIALGQIKNPNCS